MQRELHVELFDTAAQSDAPLKGVAPAAVLAGSDLGSSPLQHGVEVVTLRAFDLEDRPVVVGLASLPGELVP
ncbi:MAG: hypothetical protein M3Z15_14155, partial [Pseudomonadota bacterium]|nr:hypothetical protein [Pseudomonadota bacterium]